MLWRDLLLALFNIQLIVPELCAQDTSDDQRRVARFVHFSLNAIPVYGKDSYWLTAFGVFMAPKHCAKT